MRAVEMPSESRWSPARVTVLGISLVTCAFGLAVWHHRWLADDGLIYVRTIRLILNGDGPVFNAAERAEANTSTLWPWLVAAASALTRSDPARTTVWLGCLMSTAGLAIAMDATRRWHRAVGAVGSLVPAGALVVLGVIAFWDYGTSGLESGLSILWISGAWAALVALARAGSPRRSRWTAALLGLGPMVRPDLAVASVVFLAAGAWLARPSWRQALGLAVIAGALPVAYEIFRAGYYGVLVPLPALAKTATGARWDRGLHYVVDFVLAYLTWFPMAVLAMVGGAALRRGQLRDHARIIMLAPIVAGLLIGVFVARVGGDFMHGRLLLPPMFLLLLPAMVLPWSRATAPAIALLAAWLVVDLGRLRIGGFKPRGGIQDERLGYIIYTRDLHPTDETSYIARNIDVAGMVYLAKLAGARRLMSEGGLDLPARPDAIAPISVVAGRLGVGGVLAPLDGFAIDTLGLSNPIGARIAGDPRLLIGHEKVLPMSWVFADVAPLDEPTAASVQTSLAELRAAAHAMSCGKLAELLASVRAPMTASRFWDNLRHAVERTQLTVPTNPFVAERTFCDHPLDPNLALGASVTSSSSYQASGWSLASIADGKRDSPHEAGGFASGLGNHASHEEWVTLELPAPVTFGKVVLHPSFAHGFPIDFSIQVERDHRWVDVVRKTDYPEPPQVPQVFALAVPVTAARVRLDATRLRDTPDGALLQLAELELLP